MSQIRPHQSSHLVVFGAFVRHPAGPDNHRHVLPDAPGNIAKAAGLGRAAGLGAGGGALAGALATIFAKKPNLRTLLRNVLIGGAGGAVLGSGVHALGNAGTQVAPSEDVPPADPPPPDPSPSDPKMRLGTAAVSGLIPGIGPAVHGALTGGPGQAALSGLASLAPSAPLMARGGNRGLAAGLLLSSLGATGAAAYGNSRN